jgi:7-keto-8-aminopelargonate synthetase-like enzyme
MATYRKVVDSLRGAHPQARLLPDPALVTAAGPKDPAATDFTTLPGYRAVMLARTAADVLGLPSPFFRVIDAAAGTRVSIDGRWVENFASYDYLSLNHAPRIADRVVEAVRAHGVSATASRLVGGNHKLHAELETALADFTGTEAALVFVSGHATNQAVLRVLVGQQDLVAVDALAHNSVFEGIRVSGAQHITFPHNDWQELDRRLDEIRRDFKRVLIVTEGLFSMDGDRPDLEAFVAIKRRHDAWLMLDEAHSFGVLGQTGRGVCEETGVAVHDIDVIMGTLSKTLCSAGGFVAGSRVLIDLLRYQAPGFVYSVGLSIPNTAAALAALTALREDPDPVVRLRALGAGFLRKARSLGTRSPRLPKATGSGAG